MYIKNYKNAHTKYLKIDTNQSSYPGHSSHQGGRTLDFYK